MARAMSRPFGDQRDLSHDSASLTYWVVTSIVRPSSRSRWSSSQTVGAQERVDAGGRLVEEEQGRVVDERAGELEASLHPARELAGVAAADVPEVDAASGPPWSAGASREQSIPNSDATKSTFSRAVRSG